MSDADLIRVLDALGDTGGVGDELRKILVAITTGVTQVQQGCSVSPTRMMIGVPASFLHIG